MTTLPDDKLNTVILVGTGFSVEYNYLKKSVKNSLKKVFKNSNYKWFKRVNED